MLDQIDAQLKRDRQAWSDLTEVLPAPSDTTEPIDSVPGLVDWLRRHHVFSLTQLNEVIQADLRGSFPDLHALTRYLVDRGWLTGYQAGLLLQGRAAELMMGPYLVLELLGEGGTGQVFKVRHTKMNRLVALKLIRRELSTDRETIIRFHREVHVISQLTHPNVVHAYDAGPMAGSYFLAMELLVGTDLARLIGQSGPLPVGQVCDYARQAALGLQYIHEKGLVHRDIKPSNLFLTAAATPGAAPETGWGLLKILDLGLGRPHRSIDYDLTGKLTPTGPMMMGTLDYMVPEQALDFHSADIRADIYGLGCTLYFLLTGRPPFADGTLAQKLLDHQQKELPPLDASIPGWLDALVRRMTAKCPEDRFQTPAEVVAAVVSSTATLATTGSECPPLPVAIAVPAVVSAAAATPPWPTARAQRRRRWKAIALGGALGIALALIVYSASSSKPMPMTKVEAMGTQQNGLARSTKSLGLIGLNRELKLLKEIEPQGDKANFSSYITLRGEYFIASSGRNGRIDIFRRDVKSGDLAYLSCIDAKKETFVQTTAVLTDQQRLYIAAWSGSGRPIRGHGFLESYRLDPKSGTPTRLNWLPCDPGTLHPVPGGTNLVLASPYRHTLQLIRLDPSTGVPTLQEILPQEGLGGNWGQYDHDRQDFAGRYGASAAVPSPDGMFLYSSNLHLVGFVEVKTDGSLKYVGSHNFATVWPKQKLVPVQSLAITPDGHWAYLACWINWKPNRMQSTMALLKRDVRTGWLSFVKELRVPSGMTHSTQMEFNRDGQTGYFISGPTLGWFRRNDATGELTLGGRVPLGGDTGARERFICVPDSGIIYVTGSSTGGKLTICSAR